MASQVPPPPEQNSEQLREVSRGRFDARERIREAIHQIRDSQLYNEPQPWKAWADAFQAKQDTPTLAQKAFAAAIVLAQSVDDPRSRDYFRADAARLAAYAGTIYVRREHAAKVAAEMACIWTTPDTAPIR